MSELRDIQRVVGEQLIPDARANQTELPSLEQSLPIALELFYTAMSMKRGHQLGARFVARRYAERMGLDGDEVEAFAESRIAHALDDQP